MSRADALEQYANALRLGKKYYAAAVARKADPYPRVLEKEFGENYQYVTLLLDWCMNKNRKEQE